MKNVGLCIFVFLILAIPLHNFAQDEPQDELKLYVGEVHIIPASNPTRIVIGNPSVADVPEVSASAITINPTKAGSTNLIFWDSFGEQSFKIRVLAEDVSDIKRRVDNLLATLKLPHVYTQVAEEESRVLMLGKVKSAQEKDRVFVALGALKDKITDLIEVKEEEAVVEISVNVLELTKDSTKTLGFTWPDSIDLSESSGPTATAVTGLRNIFHVSDFTRSAFDISLDALVQEGKAKILSRPRLACQSGKEAELLVGGEKPIFTTNVVSGGGTGTEVEYKEFGIKLKVKPTVIDEKTIKLALQMEVSEIGAAEFIGLTSARTAQAYPLSKRNASTELTLNDGQTMAIGGLMRQKSEEEIRKTPFVGDVPVLGLLFRKKTSKTGGGQGEKGDTELFITLTPVIMHKEAPKMEHAASLEPLPVEEPVLETKDIPAHLTNYARAVKTKIVNATRYPLRAKNAGWEGTVKLSLNIASNGQLKNIKLLNSSGHTILDEAALDSARAQAPYPPFPPQINSQEIWVDVPIVYKNK